MVVFYVAYAANAVCLLSNTVAYTLELYRTQIHVNIATAIISLFDVRWQNLVAPSTCCRRKIPATQLTPATGIQTFSHFQRLRIRWFMISKSI